MVQTVAWLVVGRRIARARLVLVWAAKQVTRRVPQGGADVATKGDGAAVAGGDVAAGGDQQAQLQEEWTAFVKWFRSNGGIISSKLTVKVTSP